MIPTVDSAKKIILMCLLVSLSYVAVGRWLYGKGFSRGLNQGIEEGYKTTESQAVERGFAIYASTIDGSPVFVWLTPTITTNSLTKVE